VPLARRASTRITALGITALLLAVVPAVPAVGLSPTACRVTNTTTGKVVRSLPTAVAKAKKGQTLEMRGVCTGPVTIARDLTIRGVRPAGAAVPTIDGAAGGSTIVVTDDVTLRLFRLTVTGGTGTSILGVLMGGGMRVLGRAELTKVTVTGNSADNGGGIALEGAELILTGSTISANSATDLGGGIHANQAEIELRGASRVTANSADAAGGIYAGPASLSLAGTARVDTNTAVEKGGGILLGGGSFLQMSQSTKVDGNVVSASDGAGGGIHSEGATIILAGAAVVTGNRAAYSGGGVSLAGGSLTMRGTSAVRANDADGTAPKGNGGGVHAIGVGATVVLEDAARIELNDAADAGGGVLIVYGPSLTLSGTAAIAQNTAGGSGGGIYANGATNGATIDLRGSATITGNSAGSTGGGVYAWQSTLFLTCTSGATAAIFGNTPDQCAP